MRRQDAAGCDAANIALDVGKMREKIFNDRPVNSRVGVPSRNFIGIGVHREDYCTRRLKMVARKRLLEIHTMNVV